MPALIRSQQYFNSQLAEFVTVYEVDCANCGKSFKWVLEELNLMNGQKMPTQLPQDIEFLEVPPTIRPSLFGPIIKAKKRKFKNERQQIHFFSITDGVQKVKENKGGIYISSAAHLVSQCGVKTLPLGYQEKQLFSPYLSPFIPPRAPVK